MGAGISSSHGSLLRASGSRQTGCDMSALLTAEESLPAAWSSGHKEQVEQVFLSLAGQNALYSAGSQALVCKRLLLSGIQSHLVSGRKKSLKTCKLSYPRSLID